MINEPVIYAHRGFHSEKYPENSMGAFINAVNHGIPIEFDVRITKDGIPVVFHDDSLFRMTGVHSKLSKIDFSKLKTVKLQNTNERIPAFEDVLEVIDKKVPLLIEIKLNKWDLSKRTEKAVVEILKNYSGNYCIQSFDKYCVKYMKHTLEKVKCGILSSDKKFFIPDADFINYKLMELDSEKISNFRKQFENVFAWTLNSMSMTEATQTAEKFGIDGLVCNIKE